MADTENTSDDSIEQVEVDEDALRERMSPEQFEITRRAGTERAFTGAYWDHKEPGIYKCAVCDLELFESDTKYDSGSGWPSFWEPISAERVTLKEDRSFGMVRIEANCARCGSHLGHVFPDGPQPTGERYCMNSASLQHQPQD